MKRYPQPQFLLALPLLFATSCVTNKDQATAGANYATLVEAFEKPAAKFSQVRVTCVIVDKGRIQTMPPLTLRPGRSASSELPSEILRPTDYDFPQVFNDAAREPNSFPLTPANPKDFVKSEIGWKLGMSANPRDSFVMLKGTLTHKKVDRMVNSGGVPFSPIKTTASDAIGRDVQVTISDNIAAHPVIVTEEVPILIAATPGEKSRIYLSEDKQSYAEFHCEIIR